MNVVMNLRVHETRGISSLAEPLLAVQGLWPMDWFS